MRCELAHHDQQILLPVWASSCCQQQASPILVLSGWLPDPLQDAPWHRDSIQSAAQQTCIPSASSEAAINQGTHLLTGCATARLLTTSSPLKPPTAMMSWATQVVLICTGLKAESADGGGTPVKSKTCKSIKHCSVFS